MLEGRYRDIFFKSKSRDEKEHAKGKRLDFPQDEENHGGLKNLEDVS